MSVLVYDCGSVENTVTAILDTESGAMIIRGNGDIDNYADESSPWYSEHSNITQVTVDKGITRVGSGTFYGCENLSFVEIANTVTSMGADVFQNCTSLTSIKIPKSITAIGNGTFADSGLTEVKFYGNPPTVGTDIFDGVTADIYTPEGNEEWTETAKGTVAGNGSNLTWKTFDSKPNLIEYDELDYLWSKIKKYVDNNVSVTPVLTSGTKIATITVNGVATDIYSSGGLSGTVGSSTTPIYIDNGVPTACGGSLDVDITGNAATATSATTAGNVTGTVAIANGGTGATTRLNALKALTNESVSTNANYFLTITSNWGKGGYTSIADAKKLLGIDGSIPIYYVQGPSTDTTAGTWTGSITGLTAYYDGLTVLYVPAVAGASATTLNINNLGAKTCYTTNTSALTTHYSVGTPILLTYRDNAWRRADYNSNTTYSAMSVAEGTAGTATNSRTMRADYLKQIIAALPSASCTGASASCTGNAATATTATNANNVKLTTQSNSSDMPLVFGSTFTNNNGNQALHICAPTTSASDSPLRCKAYLGTASAEGQASIMLGNNIPSGSANNARGYLYLYGADSSRLLFITSTTVNKTIIFNAIGTTERTYTFPDATGTLALTSSDITGNSNSTTNAKLYHTTASERPLVFGTSFTTNDSAQALRIATPTTTAANCPLRCLPGVAAANTQGESYIVIGNNLTKASANNSRGSLLMYGTGTTYLRFLIGSTNTSSRNLTLNSNFTENHTYTLPDKNGTVALTSDLSTVISTGGGAPTVLTASSFPYTATHTLEHLMIFTSTGDTGSTTYSLNGTQVGSLGAVSGKGTTVYNSISFILRKNDVVSLNTTGFLQKATTVTLVN